MNSRFSRGHVRTRFHDKRHDNKDQQSNDPHQRPRPLTSTTIGQPMASICATPTPSVDAESGRSSAGSMSKRQLGPLRNTKRSVFKEGCCECPVLISLEAVLAHVRDEVGALVCFFQSGKDLKECHIMSQKLSNHTQKLRILGSTSIFKVSFFVKT